MAEYTILIPAYNEGAILGEVLSEFGKPPGCKEIIVVDDGSTDNTAEAARNHGARVLSCAYNTGYGAALKTGIKASKNDIIVILDGDGSYPVNEIPILLKDIDKNDMVIGARIGKNVKMSILRKIPKYILTKLAGYLSISAELACGKGSLHSTRQRGCLRKFASTWYGTRRSVLR